MRAIAAAIVLLLATPLAADDDPRITQGIALHDAGKYDEAIALYKAVLVDLPGDPLATYELAFAYQAKGDFAACRATLEPIANRRDPLQPRILTILGNCLDHAGDSRRAIDAYRKGLKIAPNDPQLLYNLAVTLSVQGKNAEAIELLKKELPLRPAHANGHYLLARLFEAEGFRAPAILEYLRLLVVETGTPRSKEAAGRLVALLNLGVEKTGESNVNLTIDPKSRTEEGDFKGWEMMLAIASAGRFLTENAQLSEFEQMRSQLAMSITMLIEAPPKGRNYSMRENLPFFARMQEKGLLDTFAGAAIVQLGLEGADEWAKKNEAAIGEYVAFLQGLPR